jgi:3-deoxy-manno-octulosonate cytidylyltransferase (CMP-KDO synthetase)
MVSHKIIGIIPARYDSTRLPGKPLIDIKRKPMIQRVYEQAMKSKYLDLILVATDDMRIYKSVKAFGGEAIMTSKNHKSGTERIVEAVKKINCEIVVNIQGDEPYIDPKSIDLAIKPLLLDKNVNVSTLCFQLTKKNEIEDSNVVKVIFDKHNNAIYFSRYPIPYNRNKNNKVKYYKHIGLYVYRKDYLTKYIHMKESSPEKAEKLEQLRILENGEKIRVVETKCDSISIDTKEDLKKINTSIIK